MDAKLVYWSLALVNLTFIVLIAIYAAIQVPRRRIRRHHGSMLVVCLLVLGFLVSYAFKLMLLGREDHSLWSGAELTTLRIHETFVLVMVVSLGLAGWRAWSIRTTRNFTDQTDDPPASAALLRRHRRAGWTAVVCAVFGLLTAAMVLVAMYRRAGFF
ncbi:MAG: DUF420 domain-containing protein [Myxococcota bacterium]